MFQSSSDFHAKKRPGFISPELHVCNELTEGSLAWRLLYLCAAKSTWDLFAPVCHSNGHLVVKT